MNVDNQVDNKLVFLVARASFNLDCLHMTNKPFMVSCWITPILPGFDLKLIEMCKYRTCGPKSIGEAIYVYYLLDYTHC